ncbi:START domain-containing protein [Paraglaciecola sp. 20A4]|uniref:START domain-containing protein n=1 Tax=Paraglaciecola sp. 20A4 TaxID=2687288 RepID=UPI00140B97A0|nr:START domain-containing protein [Paraglaciecola sp. 20A4]
MQSPFKFNLCGLRTCLYHLFFLPCVLQAQSLEPASTWNLASSSENVTVYQREIENNQLAVRGIAHLNTSIKAFLQLLDDTKRAPLWIANCREVTVLFSNKNNIRIVHSKFAAPWPIKDRDMVTKSVSYYQHDILFIDIIDVGDQYPQNDGYVRMQKVNGQWKLFSTANGRLTIEYTGQADPVGKIPSWLANRTLISSVRETFENIVQQLDNITEPSSDM